MTAPEDLDAVLSATDHASIHGEALIFRTLSGSDADAFGAFLEGLSPETVRRYRPHRLTREAAREVCGRVGREDAIRLIAVTIDQPRIVAYFAVELTIPESEHQRYQQYAVPLSDKQDCRIAPAVADAYQNSGLGSLMMPWVLDLLRRMGRHRVVLFGGTQASNTRAVHFYEKFGFISVGTFEEKGLQNIDMILSLT